jgi:uncharacterized protein YcfJ
MAIKQGLTLGLLAACACSSAMAQAQGRVLSATPVTQEVGVPQQFCQDEQVYVGQRTNGTGALVGAIIGGIAGNAMGQGAHRGPRGRYTPSTRGPSTVVGALAGGLIGNAVESSNTPSQYDTMRRCTNETVYENRTVGYDVTYEYAGRRYIARMDRHPGAWVPVDVRPQGSYSSAPSTGQYVGPSGVYRSAPAGVVVTESYTYGAPQSVMPVVVGVDRHGHGQPFYPAYPYHGHRPPPPHAGYWR